MFTESVVAELPSLEPAQLEPDPSEDEHELFAPEPLAVVAPRGRPRQPGEPLPAGALSPVGFGGPRIRPPGSAPNAPPISLLRSSAGLDPLPGAPALSMQPMKGRLNLPAPPPAATEPSVFAAVPTDLADTQPPPFDATLADSLVLSTSIPPASPTPASFELPVSMPAPSAFAATALALEAPAVPEAPVSDARTARDASAGDAPPAAVSEPAMELPDALPDSKRPAKERRADARRAARRKSAKSLPPPAARTPLRWSPTQIGLAAFGGGLLVLALGLGSALAGLWSLPPSAADALGLRDAQGSLNTAIPNQAAHQHAVGKPTNGAAQPLAADSAPNSAANGIPPSTSTTQSSAAPARSGPSADAKPSVANGTMSAAAAKPRPSPPSSSTSPTDVAPATPAEPTSAVWPPVVNHAAEAAPQAKLPAVASPPGPATAPLAAAAARPAPVQPSSPIAAAPTAAVTQPSAASPAAADVDPTDTRKLLLAARNRVSNGDALGAAAMLERAVARDPDDHHLQDGLAQAQLALGKGKEALAYAQKIIRKRPRRAAYRLLEGDAYMLLGNRVAAVSSWRVALELEPLNGEAKRRLGH